MYQIFKYEKKIFIRIDLIEIDLIKNIYWKTI